MSDKMFNGVMVVMLISSVLDNGFEP